MVRPGAATERSTIAAAAPFSNAWARKSWASKFAPRRAKKRSPARIERVSVETPVTVSEARGRLGRPLTARATWLSCIIPLLLGFGLSADLAVVVVDVRQRDVEILGRDFLHGFEDPQRQIRREVEAAVDVRAAHHVFLPLSGRTPPSHDCHPRAAPSGVHPTPAPTVNVLTTLVLLLLGQVAQDLAGDLAVVEADRLVAEDLVRLVALAGDQDDVVLLGRLEGQLDRAAPVGLDRVVRPALHAGHDVAQDRGRAL